MNNTRLAVVFAGVAVVTGAAAFLAQLFAFGSPAIVGLAPTALGISLSLAFLDRRTRQVVVPLFLFGMAATTFAVVSWSVGFDEADAGAPRSLLGNLFVPAATIAYLLLAASVAIAAASALRMRTLPRVLTAGAIGLLSVPFAIPLLSPLASVVAAVALMLVLALRGRTPGPARPRASAGRGVRALALIAFGTTVLSLGYGLVAGILLVGTDGASQAMAMMAAGGNLAALPLMAALNQRAAPGRVGPWIGLVVSGLGVIATSIVWMVGVDLSGGLFLVIPAFVGVWGGTLAGVVLPHRGVVLLGMSVVVAIGTAVAYFMFALTTAGAALAIISGFLAFGGRAKMKEIRAEMAS